ncbi:MAG: hypothetical protein ABSD13_15145 [Candidatus Korobacteraceae bacterium]|jgi:hypothetical protein
MLRQRAAAALTVDRMPLQHVVAVVDRMPQQHTVEAPTAVVVVDRMEAGNAASC